MEQAGVSLRTVHQARIAVSCSADRMTDAILRRASCEVDFRTSSHRTLSIEIIHFGAPSNMSSSVSQPKHDLEYIRSRNPTKRFMRWY